ncbi:MAG: biotin/lipoyl-containing protein [Dehalococcoidia bacterium]|nr:biotin/lipoyl-containing protein [Dehalococcoidia bacterium]
MGKTFRLTVNDKTYNVEVGDLSQPAIEVIVDGETFNVRLERDVPEMERRPAPAIAAGGDPVTAPPPPAPRTKAPAAPPAAGDGKVLCAPMPGVVLAVRVKAGDKVKRGQEVCLLESMKMELNILAAADGVVKKVHVSQGQNVAHGATLVEFE